MRRRARGRPWWSAAASLIVALGLGIAAAPESLASFGESAQASTTLATAVLAPPTGLTATASCDGTLTAKAALGWSLSTTEWADGPQQVWRATSAADANPTLVDGGLAATATAYTATGLALATTYWFEVRATHQSWSAASSRVSVTTPTLCLL